MTAPLVSRLRADLQERVASAQAAERQSQRRTAREGYEYVLSQLDQSRDGRMAAALIRWIGRTYVEDADLDAALDCCEAALAAASVNGDRSGIAHAVNLKAIVYQRRGQLDEAERLYQDARERARGAHEPQLLAMIAQNLGTIANIRGDLRLALKHYKSSLAQYRALGLDEYVGPLLTNLGIVYTDLRRWRSAERAFDEAVLWCQRAGDLAAETVAEADRARMWLAQVGKWLAVALHPNEVGRRSAAMTTSPTHHRSEPPASQGALAALLSGMGLVGLVLLLGFYVQHG
jgi:tetratricopeptide (TPR) repeat protein